MLNRDVIIIRVDVDFLCAELEEPLKVKAFPLQTYQLAALAVFFGVVIAVCVVLLVCSQKKRKKLKELVARESARNEMITQWTKKIIIEKQQMADVSEPLVSLTTALIYLT